MRTARYDSKTGPARLPLLEVLAIGAPPAVPRSTRRVRVGVVMDGGLPEGEDETRRGTLPELFMELGTDGVIHAVRGRRLGDFGIDPSNAVGRRISDVLSPSQADAIRDCVERAIRTDTVVFTEHLSSAGGRRQIWQARTIPLGPDRALRMVIDMSEQLRWHHALERSEARFRQLVEQAV